MKRIILVALCVCGICGCSTENEIILNPNTPTKTGEQCPPDGISGKFMFIHDMSCTADDCILGNYQTNFEQKQCPKAYPDCLESDVSGMYYCEKSKNEEPEDIKCSNKDIDPTSDKTCGANDCKADNYGGEDCTVYTDNRPCQKIEDVYKCACPDGETECNGKCVDLTDKKHCGTACIDCTEIHENAVCSINECVIPMCQNGYHPIMENGRIQSCEKNSNEACAPVAISDNSEVLNCTEKLGEGVETAECSAAGICVVTACAAGYKPNNGNGCTKVECAETQYEENGECHEYKSACEIGFHISEDRKSCVANSVSACGASTGWPNESGIYIEYVEECDDTMTTCDNGVCGCGDNMVLNNEKTACVPRECMGFPGISVGKTIVDSNGVTVCRAKECQEKYYLQGSMCLPKCSGQCKCGKLMPGYIAGSCMSDSGAPHVCEASACNTGYTLYGMLCIESDYSCGKTYVNCAAQGKTCNKGNCV